MYSLVKSAVASLASGPLSSHSSPKSGKLHTQGLTQSEIRQVCSAAAKALPQSLGLSCCVFGRAACRLYGCSRPVEEVDILVLTNRFAWTRDHILKLLVLRDETNLFFLAPGHTSKDKELWYNIPSGGKCRVCISLPSLLFTPNALNIPPIPPKRLKVIRSIPVMPLVPLLLLKLQSDWYTEADREDINDLMGVLEDKFDLVNQVCKAKRWLPHWFIQDGREDVKRYTDAYGLADHASWYDFEAWLLDDEEE